MDMYKENDKVMILETGEVLTVIADFSDRLDRGIIVKENIGRNVFAVRGSSCGPYAPTAGMRPSVSFRPIRHRRGRCIC